MTDRLEQVFHAYDVRAIHPDPLDENTVWQIGVAVGRHLKDSPFEDECDHPDTVVVGRDMRPSSAKLRDALSDGIRAAGMNVIDVGLVDTPFVYFAVNRLSCAGGVQVTASHNPIEYNGLKVSGRKAKPIGQPTGLFDIKDIAKSVGDRGSIEPTGDYKERDLWLEYRDHVLSFLGKLQRPIKVAIDASNGMAGRMIPKVFEGYPDLEIIPLNFEITGSFVHEPNPLVPENMKPTQDAVSEHNADFGVCFDGDADRCILCDDQGQIIGCDHLTALLTETMLDHSDGAAIVYDLRSSKVVEQRVRELGGEPVRGRVGHVFMKQALREQGGVFGGELSGHFYFRDNFCADSGAIAFAAALNAVSKSDQPMSEQVKPYRKYPQSGEVNFKLPSREAMQEVMANIKAEYGDKGAVDELDGVSIDAWDKSGWWVNVRASNTEPKLRFNAEAKDKPTLDALVAEMFPKIGTPLVGH